MHNKNSSSFSQHHNLRIPILPVDSPAAKQPAGLKLPLRDHQLRALSRVLTIEDPSSNLQNEFGDNTLYRFQSRGGVLADRVGTGKTAVMISTVLNDAINERDTLIVTPSHLVSQWKTEIEKFVTTTTTTTTTDSDSDSQEEFTPPIEVVVGKDAYETNCSIPAHNRRRVVLVDVDTVLGEKRLWYDWRQCYAETETNNEGPNHNNNNHSNIPLKLPTETLKRYQEAAQFSVKSAKGNCAYTGWVYTGSLHLPQYPWRRVIYDEIQDLVQE
ncbi:MAG: hypothetical protein SGARI_007989, partial [Bacillariaceae sp.]